MAKRITKKSILQRPVEHLDITSFDTRPLIEQERRVRGSAGDAATAVDIYNRMLTDPDCTIIFTLAGSSSAQGLMNVWPTLVQHKMVDVVIATGASLIDMDLFEALGYRHWRGGNAEVSDHVLGDSRIDRIYDTFIQEDDLQNVDAFCREFLNGLPTLAPYSPQQLMWELGKTLSQNPAVAKKKNSLLQVCYEHDVPVFCLGLTDSAFGMGSTYHQMERDREPMVTVDTTPEYADLAKLKLWSKTTGLFMIGGGVPKNHAQDTVIVAQGILDELRRLHRTDLVEHLGYGPRQKKDEIPLHRYAIQITAADPRDGACSSSTLKEARSWGKVSLEEQVMVFGEATGVTPSILSAVYHEGHWKKRKPRRYARLLHSLNGPADFGRDYVRS